MLSIKLNELSAAGYFPTIEVGHLTSARTVPRALIGALFDAKTVSIHSRFGLDADDAVG